LERAADPRDASAPDPGARLLSALLLVALLAPCAFLSYLPMTDLPQHLAAVSILLHLDDPRFGFANWYAPAWDRSLYALPYLLTMGLAPLVSLEVGMRIVILLSLALLPIGVFALLRALGKPEWLVLLAFPLVYNRAFFWGFVNFQLGLGLALLALAILVRPPRGWASELTLAVLCALIVVTHPYGLLILAGYIFLWLLLGERRALARHALALSPLALGLLVWGLWSGGSQGPPAYVFSPLLERLDDFEESALGGYRDASEARLLLGFLAAWAVLAAPAFPATRARWRALSHHERVLFAFTAVNLLLYAVVPSYTHLVGEAHARHAVIVVTLLPVLAARGGSLRRARWAKAALAILAAITIAIAWVHLIRFDREARGFDQVVERIPFGARVVGLIWDANGGVMRTKPYWHFTAYAQAHRGGLIADSFPRKYRNIPVRMREGLQLPPSPPTLDSKPYLFDYDSFGFAYDHIVMRMGETKGRDRFPVFPYQLVYEAPPWQLWRARPRSEAPPESLDAGRLGRVSLFRPTEPKRGFVFLFSDLAGFGPDLAQAGRELAEQGVAVVGVDLQVYLRGLAASDDGCHYVVAEIEALSQRLQRELGFDGYRSPLLAGAGAGATLAWAALAQAPAATLAGAVCVGRAPSLGTRVPLCPGAPSHAVAEGGFAYEPVARLPGTLDDVPRSPGESAGAQLARALAPPLGQSGAGLRTALLEKLPLVEVPAQKPGDLFAVIYSGDGGWRDLDKTIAEILAKRGVPVVGVDSLRYFWREKTPDGVARDLAAILGAYSERWGPRKAVLIGYSFGAGILPFAVNRLPESARASVVQISLLGLEPTAPFEFHVSGWLGGHAEDGLPVLPELERIDPALIQCVYGEQEENTLCRAKQLARTERIQTTGGHHFDGDFEGLAGKILAGAEKRLAAQRQGHQRATTPVTPPEISAATSVSTKGIASPPGAAR
jgi:type IV secretory pathway VirJ component